MDQSLWEAYSHSASPESLCGWQVSQQCQVSRSVGQSVRLGTEPLLATREQILMCQTITGVDVMGSPPLQDEKFVYYQSSSTYQVSL
jgi:hypothetical protein